MNCKNCGAPLEFIKCKYCGTENIHDSQIVEQSERYEEIQFEITQINDRIEKISQMPMPQVMKDKKIEILKKQMMELKSQF